jgi:hypothetical protein
VIGYRETCEEAQTFYEVSLKAFDEDEKHRRIEERYRRQVASFRVRRGK